MTANRHNLIIAGKQQPPVRGGYFDVSAPETGQLIGQAARATAEDVELAVAAARQGYLAWQAFSPSQREAVLLKAADAIARDGEQQMLDLLIDESGSTINKARGEISYSVDLLRAAAGEVRRLYGETFPNDNPQRMSMVFREALGVVAVISPYNAPLALLVKMAAFPLAAGNAVVIKPSEETPLIALKLAHYLIDAGMPTGTVNVLTGLGQECGAPLVDHHLVDCIAFTGSTNTGIAIAKQSAEKVRRCQLELGGKSALLVLRDVDVEHAARTAAQGIYAHAGQICMANSRIIVERPVFDAFLQAFKKAAQSLPLGNLRDPQTAYGPLINSAALTKVQQHVDAALAAGATLLTGGKVREGLIFEPTAVIEPDRQSAVWREETFGPLVSIVAADNLEQAIALANDSQYGLSGAVLTSNVNRAMRAARGIRAGSVHIGCHAFQSNAMAPIGGFGLSGIGRSGGKYSTEEFTELKWVSIDPGEADD